MSNIRWVAAGATHNDQLVAALATFPGHTPKAKG